MNNFAAALWFAGALIWVTFAVRNLNTGHKWLVVFGASCATLYALIGVVYLFQGTKR